MPSHSATDPGRTLLARVLTELSIPLPDDQPRRSESPGSPLPSRLATEDLAWASVASCAAAAGIRTPLSTDRIAVAYRSDRLLTIDSSAPSVWSPYSGFWRTEDGWVRTHGNYPHHARGLLRGLDIVSHPEHVGSAIAERSSAEAVAGIRDAGGLAVVVAPESREQDEELRHAPLLDLRRIGDGAGRRSIREPGDLPLRGIRVLDLTRVIAGPVCTRTLALLGADVLRIDPPELPEPEWQHLDTGHGKRTAVLDARSPAMTELLDGADVVVVGYRPSALERLGLSPESLAERYPGLVIAQLSAWGIETPDRAGFDSLVQAESGIALIESVDGDRPGVLPAQALDHSAGYLLAAAVTSIIERRRREGGGHLIRTSLRRIAAELLGMPRRTEPQAEREIETAAHTVDFSVGGQTVTTARPALPGLQFSAPHPWGSDQPRW